jgi:glycerophosphoryl diester phosphodiesterase
MSSPVFRQRATLVGHRGMGAGTLHECRENTLPSFLAAIGSGIQWLEVDVRRSRDDELFVWHDAAVPDGRYLADIPAVAARRMDVLPLEELLEALPPAIGVVFDVKSSLRDAERSAGNTTSALLARTCKRALNGRRAVVTSFDPAGLHHTRQVAPEMALGLLTWLRFPIGQAVAAAAHLDVHLLSVHAGSLSPPDAAEMFDEETLSAIVGVTHAAGLQLMVWCPSIGAAAALTAVGVDAMVVDDVPSHVEALKTLDERVPGQRVREREREG